MRGKVGLLAHEALLYRDLSARENLRFHARLHRVAGGARRGAAGARCACAAAPTTRCARCRSGLLQRVAVCRAVLHDPPLLLLDEPRANLDPAAAELIEPLIGARERAHARGRRATTRLAGWRRPTSRSGCATGGSLRARRGTGAVEELYR